MKTSKNACIIRSECTHYAYILLCKQTFQIGAYLYSRVHNNTFLFEKFPVLIPFILLEGESVYRAPDNFQVQRVITPTFENDAYLHISFALLYSILQKRWRTCTLLKLCWTQVLFNKHRMQVKCISLFNLTRLCHVY